MSSEFIFSFFDVCKSYKGKEVLNNCNLTVYKNELVGLIGTSGSGKTTIIKLLLNLEYPSKGRVIFNSQSRYNENLVGFVSQDNLFYEELSIYENLYYYAKLLKVEKNLINSRIQELLELIHLQTFNFTIVKKLSGGMKRRLELALALINDPKILILDEPFTGLDLKLKLELWEFIKKINKMGLTIIISTHQIELIKEGSDKFLFLKNKTITELDPLKYDFEELVKLY